MIFDDNTSRQQCRVRQSFHTYKGKKAQLLHEGRSMEDNVLDLIDNLRVILNTMLEDETGIYPVDEILGVSRELDDMIYCYYQSTGAAPVKKYMEQ